MRRLWLAIAILPALAGGGALAQSINLTGIYTCVDRCRGAYLPISRKTDLPLTS